ncbi:hypothetical protein EBU71_14755, partial [bacterium]|nr:hypothetical protein [Candidatus Elulimicrobium humile]
MTLVVDKFRSLLPKIKTSPSGWMSFNAPCCHHRGHRADTRKRAGVILTEGIVYNCFNCKFSTGWKPGSTLSPKFKTLCQWLGASDDILKELSFEALKTESEEYVPTAYVEQKIEFADKELPEGSMPLLDWIESAYYQDVEDLIEPVIAYIDSRGFDLFDGNFYWSPAPGYENRVIIPFFYQGKIVGNTARKISNGRPKYLSDQHPFFVYNVDAQKEDHKYVFVVEGPFDALSIGGVALLTNEVSDQQSRIINSIGKEVIVIPDQDQAGTVLIDQASRLGWKIAFPNWDEDIKDCADAVARYG